MNLSICEFIALKKIIYRYIQIEVRMMNDYDEVSCLLGREKTSKFTESANQTFQIIQEICAAVMYFIKFECTVQP